MNSQPIALFTHVDIGVGTFAGQQLHDLLSDMREQAPLVKTKFLGMESYVITRYDGVVEAFRDNERFPPERIYKMMFEPIAGPTFQTMTGQNHLLRRQLATKAFRAKAVRSYDEALIANLADELLDRVGQKNRFDLAVEFTRLYPFILISRLLGIPRDAEGKFHGWALALLRFAEDFKRARAANEEFTAYLRPILEQRRQQPGDDIISNLLTAEVDGQKFTLDEVLSHIRLLFSAGASTTHDALGNLVFHLLRTPNIWQMLRDNMALREAAVEELLRFDPPVPMLPRTGASVPSEFQGYTIPANAIVLFAIAAANRDPRVFAAPNEFRLDRGETLILTTFGPGPRACPGMHLARKQLVLVLDKLLQRFPTLQLVDYESAQPQGAILRGPANMLVQAQPA